MTGGVPTKKKKMTTKTKWPVASFKNVPDVKLKQKIKERCTWNTSYWVWKKLDLAI